MLSPLQERGDVSPLKLRDLGDTGVAITLHAAELGTDIIYRLIGEKAFCRRMQRILEGVMLEAPPIHILEGLGRGIGIVSRRRGRLRGMKLWSPMHSKLKATDHGSAVKTTIVSIETSSLVQYLPVQKNVQYSELSVGEC
ncbi:hypothetical protein GIB67_012993 [Kingdonia uniflora]|uniref:Uncharacterized protein n=1 Tax=Kingdonia uniflora TaxID=39325 RepID=A0A7J7MCC1_9MAGN|nr:hypothetical protein GIB67_012993 [Kingdonia uniflora]